MQKVINIPEPNRENTPRDDVVLEYLDNFRRQFVQLYPDRPKLFLHPKNEHGAEKFATTFIKSTKLPYKDLYDYPDAARFIADHLLYAPLSAPPHTSRNVVEPPTSMNSPTYVLEHRANKRAHCFEYSSLLVSILLGVGYDAYCVYGYASKAVTLNDQTQREPPFSVLSQITGDEASSATNDSTTYESLIAKKPYLHSQYLKSKEDKKKLEEELAKASLGEGEKDENNNNIDKDPLEGHRLHCWVLLLPGKRLVETPIFIEPTTGLVIPSDSKDYIGIEAVWNDSNYWLNMQTIRPTDFNTLSYDLGNNYKWEPLFLDPDTPIIGKPPAKYTIKTAGDKSARNDPELGILRCPTTWVKRIEISKHEFLTRFPNGETTVEYKLCTVSRYSEYHRDDGMVMHVTMYADDDRKQVVEYREYYANRKDFLEQRRRIVSEGTVREIFAKGRANGLKEYIKTPEKSELVFHPSIRIDGLAKRIEYFGRKTAETYEGRDDFLVYRCVAFSNDPNMETIRLSETETSLPMRKITEKFDRSPDTPADEDVQKIIFAMDQKKIFITYHRAEGRITAASRIYTKEGKAKDYQVDPFGAKPTPRQLAADFHKITAIERECIQKLRDTDREAAEIIKTRTTEEEKIELTTNIHDTWRGGKKKGEEEKEKWKAVEEEKEEEKEEEEEDGKKEHDALARFMHLGDNKPMNRETAQLIKESALRTLKERLIQKANLIHSRLEKETNALLRLQANHQRGKDNYESAEDEEAYSRQTHESLFRIRVLEERLSRHEKMALEKFQALDQKIMADPRVMDYL